MNRRGFIGAMLGVAAATALPSEMWPFRKIFLPPVIDTRIDLLDWRLWGMSVVPENMFLQAEYEQLLAEHITGFYPGLYGAVDNRTAAAVITHRRETERKVERVLAEFLS